jgi:hypothetical protein
MAELLACWKCRQPVYANARCKNCGASYTLPTRAVSVLMWAAPAVGGLWLLFFTSAKTLALGIVIALGCYLVFGLGRNYQWRKQSH